MSRSLADSIALHQGLVTRSLVVLFGCVAVWWGLGVFPTFWQQSSAERVARRIIAGDAFKPEVLSEQVSALVRSEKSGFCRPAALESAAIIQLRIAETASKGSLKGGPDLNRLDGAVRASLSCAPVNSFMWLVLFALENATNGYQPQNLRYLRMSYADGPNEGWILERRNPLVMGGFELLPADLAAKATDEFMHLLKDKSYQRAVDIFCKTTPSRRGVILSHMTTLPLTLRKSFAKSVYDCGLDVEVPGVEEASPKRPW